MLNLVTEKDLVDVWTKLQEVMERTLRHTKQIQYIERELKGGKQDGRK